MDFTPLIVLGSISLFLCSISVLLFAVTYFSKSRFDTLCDGKYIIYKGETYEKKN